MQGKYILLVLVLLLLTVMPSAGSTTRIISGAPVFVGESNIDLTRALDNCRIIGWWPEGTEPSFPAVKNITLRPLNEVSSALSKYTFSPAEYRNYTGTWYCEERQPFKPVFVVQEPEIRIRVWDIDADRDVSGETIPSTANVTYRIDTNTDAALQVKYRPELTPADGFMKVLLTDPSGKRVTNIYTANYGAPGNVILTVDEAPYITKSPYIWNFWKGGSFWNRAARNIQGDLVYPPGTYRFTASQNLNRMAESYSAAGITDTDGKLTSTAAITFAPVAVITTTPAAAVTPPAPTLPATMPEPVPVTTTGTPVPPTPVPTKTVYQPLPAWIALAALALALLAASGRGR
jgi:hypothetical protein